MKKPVLYVEHLPTDKKRLAFDFCYSAKMGAEQLDVKVKVFEDSDEVPGDPTNILVGSVEMLSKWLDKHGYNTPEQIDVTPFAPYLRREVGFIDIDDFIQYATECKAAGTYTPLFIKPATKIKAFTGFVADDPKMIPLWSCNYSGRVMVQPDMGDILSEYRVYISNNRIVGMKHYAGDPFVYPNPEFIHKAKEVGDTLNYHSYVLDFGVVQREQQETLLIEPNDGWAIGNYGLDPQKYYLFVRDRWLQMTGVRYRMDHF